MNKIPVLLTCILSMLCWTNLFSQELPSIRAIRLETEKDSVSIFFETDTSTQNLLLYRSTHPIQNTRDLVKAVVVESGLLQSPVTDYPVPGLAYFYAILNEDELKSGSANLVPGENTSRLPVEIAIDETRLGLSSRDVPQRAMPLPYLSVSNLFPLANQLEASKQIETPLSPQASNAVASVLNSRSRRPLAQLTPQILSGDTEAASGAEEYTLRQIISQEFTRKEWEAAQLRLNGYLSLPRSAISESKARFYLGQTQYFLKNYRQALFEFLLAQQDFPLESRRWIQSTLAQLSRSANGQF